MGINSQGVAYNFGQLGSALLSGADNTITAPEGQAIVAITFLGDTTNTGALSALVSSDNTKFVNHDASAHSTGTYTRTVNGASSANKVIFDEENTISGNNIIEVGDELYITSTGVSLGTVTALNPDGDNTKEISRSTTTTMGDGITITFVKPKLSGYRGVGGMTLTASHKIPAGTTIYGRWDSISANHAEDLLIVYFGE
tara:strand:- start:198 stop:794 length:597 start_codon:yes stop_codon:yes gene_type:complete